MPTAKWHAVSRTRLANYYLRDLGRSALRSLLRRVRTRDRVSSEYDAGHWRRVLERQSWLESPDLRTFLVGDDGRIIVAKIDGRVVHIPANEYYRWRLSALVAALGEHIADDERPVELGCGFGYNLFSLAMVDRWQSFVGLDISENGLRAGRAISAHFGLEDRVRFGPLDLTDTGHPGFAQIAGQTVFTFCCIEQVPASVGRVVDNILRHRPRRVIHIEPTTELLNLWRPMDLLNYAYVKSVDYQTRLFSTLATLRARGDIRILAQRRLSWAPTIHNDTFLVVWEPADVPDSPPAPFARARSV